MAYDNHAIVPPAPAFSGSAAPTAIEKYLFDLRGYLLIESLLSADEIAAESALIGAIPSDLPRGGWHGWVQRQDDPEHRGISYQQVYELGGVFERMIDHSRVLNLLDRFIGVHETSDRYQGPLAIDENFFTIRSAGDAIPIHAGGHETASRTGYRYQGGASCAGRLTC